MELRLLFSKGGSKLSKRIEHCNWLINKRKRKEPIRCCKLYWPLRGRGGENCHCFVVLSSGIALGTNFNPANFLTFVIIKDTPMTFSFSLEFICTCLFFKKSTNYIRLTGSSNFNHVGGG